jgi:uncharacterized protein
VIAALFTDRPDRCQITLLLLAFGANVQAHGINDWTPLHYAAAAGDLDGIRLLLARGDPNARTRIDACATPLEEAEILGRDQAAQLLRKLAPG